MKMTVSEYAKELNVSVQTIYKKINRGVIKSVKENNTIYVVLDNKEGKTKVKQSSNTGCSELLKLVKSQQKEIKRLTKSLEKARSEENQTLKEVYHEMKALKQLSPPMPKKEADDIIDLEEVKKSKKGSKKKKKGKK